MTTGLEKLPDAEGEEKQGLAAVLIFWFFCIKTKERKEKSLSLQKR